MPFLANLAILPITISYRNQNIIYIFPSNIWKMFEKQKVAWEMFQWINQSEYFKIIKKKFECFQADKLDWLARIIKLFSIFFRLSKIFSWDLIERNCFEIQKKIPEYFK